MAINRPKAYFKLGQLVLGFTLDHKEIIGEYRGKNPSFGVHVFGRPIKNLSDPPQLYHCLSLTLRKAIKPKTFKVWRKFEPGDPVIGYTSSDLRVWGHFVQPEGKYAFIRGWRENTSRSEAPQVIKVLRNTLTKPE